ncbi:uncharacterized protein LOC128548180 [Mercenaria mercenaria]|uniref:uncharacterized protein LOC128548180 n=1 Tax=Mercenaria mercenaria TaxID=6596 RepID=UPI00234E7A2B|nr:uncharacterized protein LOC128548180 [Mercenaria mercenaria]
MYLYAISEEYMSKKNNFDAKSRQPKTWLNNSVPTEDLLLSSFHTPERRDRVGDTHGGVILYIKDSLQYRRRLDLELNRLECIWVEITLYSNRHILFGVFYRPPNTDSIYNNLVEDSIGLAIDTNISDVIITGDFNYNVFSPITNRKITSVTQQFILEQLIDQPTHFTELSESLIDLIFVSNKNNVLYSGVGEHFLDQEQRYHTPVFGLLKFQKPKRHCFDRLIWEYDRGDYDSLRDAVKNHPWDNYIDVDINTYANLNTTQTTYSDLDKANLLNDYFVQQTNIDDDSREAPDLGSPNSLSFLSDLILRPVEFEDVLKSLQVDKAAGPDGISNRLLREISHELSFPLCKLFNASLQSCTLPSAWKEAHVTAIHKKGDALLPSNYRPVSLLNTTEKVFERLVFRHVFNHLQDINFLTTAQSGFIPGDSTVNQLVLIYETLCKALDDGLEVRVVFFDISKAFDKVWHKGLLSKLEYAGITGPLLSWFQSYLSDRRQRVILPGTQSSWAHIKAGVPQGSILGPLLFLIFINDIVHEIRSCINLFADDTSLYVIVEQPDSAATLLQSDIQTISSWANKW